MINLLNIRSPRSNESLRGFIQKTAEFNNYSETIWVYQLIEWQRYYKTLNPIFPINKQKHSIVGAFFITLIRISQVLNIKLLQKQFIKLHFNKNS